jgi:adenosine deaminase
MRKIVSKNHRTTTAQVTAELNIHLDDSVSRKTVQRELHKSHIHGRAATAEPLITESNAQMRKRWCHDHKTGSSGNRKRAHEMVR